MSEQSFSAQYKRLNDEQRRAVDTIEGPVMVIAGPGTGKTQILTLRIANILKQTDTPPDAILALTFTESAAAGMRRRLIEIIGSAAYRVRLHTFHGYANNVIERFPDAFPRIVGARAVSDVERVMLMQEIIAETPLELLRPFGDPTHYVQPSLQKISELKRENLLPDDYAKLCDERESQFAGIEDLYHTKGAHKGSMKGAYAVRAKRLARDRELIAVYRAYEEALAKRRLYDYEDMIVEVVRALERDRDVLLPLQEEAQYILADEHQDANASQNRLLELLAGFHEHPNLFVVGDEKQAIYRFQGASLANFAGFLKAYPDAQVIALQNNYRSTQDILDSAHALMQHAPVIEGITRPKLKSAGSAAATSPLQGERVGVRGVGGPCVRAALLPTPADERAFVAEEIKALLGEGVEPADIAVLCRTNRDTEAISEVLARHGVPTVVASNRDAFSDYSIRQFISLLAAVANYGDDSVLVPALHSPFLRLHPLYVARFLAKAPRVFATPHPAPLTPTLSLEKERGQLQNPADLKILSHSRERMPDRAGEGGEHAPAGLWEILSDEIHLKKLNIRDASAFASLAKKLARWVSVSQDDGLLAVLEAAAEESGLVSHLLAKDAPEERVAALQALFDEARALQESDRRAGLQEFLARLDVLQEHRIALSSSRAHASRPGVRIMTAHRAKGLEFPYVYVLHCNDGQWGNRTSRNLFSPLFVAPTAADEHDQDDERRLFYVALTRAKLAVCMTLAGESETGRALLPSQFLEEMTGYVTHTQQLSQATGLLAPRVESPRRNLLDKTLVQELFTAQGLSVTALNNYLACPWNYFYRNLIRIPEAPSRSGAYGTAIHEALRHFYDRYKEGETIDVPELLRVFDAALERSPLRAEDIADARRKGHKALPVFYEQRCKDAELPPHIINELPISALLPMDIEGLTHVRVRGVLDRVECDDSGNASVFDYKTGKRKTRRAIEGKEIENADGTKISPESDASAWGDYKRQLVFYQILLGLFDNGKWQMRRGIIDFVEPDKSNPHLASPLRGEELSSGECFREIFEFPKNDERLLLTLITKIAKEIWNLSFADSKCEDVECRYCALRQALG